MREMSHTHTHTHTHFNRNGGVNIERENLFYFIIFLINLFYLFLAVLGLRCVWAFSSCIKWGLLFVPVRRLLTAVASLVAEHGL